MNFRNKLTVLVFGLVLFCCASSTWAQSSGSIQGVVKDATGGILTGATVQITDPATGYQRDTVTGAAGDFRFTNIPFNPYHLTVSAKGFSPYTQDVDLRSTVPVALDISMKLGTANENITVEATAGDLVETEPTYHTDVDRDLFDKLPLESASSSVSSLVTLSTPGVAADSNGLFHGLGDHASNSFSVDGQPITDQQSKVFSNQIPEDSIQSLEVISGAPPAEFGGKTSLVIVATTRSGLGETMPHGQVTASYGSFGSENAGFNLAFGSNNLGNFISANALNTARFLDPPEFGVQHDRGNEENAFDRLDYKPSSSDTVSLNFNYSRSWFQTPNSYDAQNATAWSFNEATQMCQPPQATSFSCGGNGLGPNGQLVGPADQRSKIGTFDIAPSWTRVIGTNTVFTLGGWARRDQFNYYPSANPFADASTALQTSTVGQDRSLLNAGARASLSYVKGIHNIKAGVDFQHTFLTEKDQYGIVDPTENAVCLNGDGSPYTDPSVTNPALCTGLGLTANDPTDNADLGASVLPFTPLLGCYDLTRTAALPATDMCPGGLTHSGLFPFNGHTDIKETALFAQDTITMNRWTFNLGLRVDLYNGLASARQAEPRVGIAYNIKSTNTVLRISYARTMESPFNENLIIASTGCGIPAIFDFQLDVAGASCSTPTATPLTPGKRNEFHAGFEQAFGRYFVLDAEYIWKYTTRAFDFSVLDNTPVTYPIEWANSKIPGYMVRGSVPNIHGLTAFVVMSGVAARFNNPQISGIGATPGSGGIFRIDHDEKFDMTTHIQYQPFKKSPWVGFNWRYDSGLVAGALPYAGAANYDPATGNCIGCTYTNGPNGVDGLGSKDVVDASALTPDQQFQAGLYCGSSFATPTTPFTSALGPNLCPVTSYGSKYLKIPAPDTENDDHNVPRVLPRNLFDVSLGDDNIFNKDRYKVSLRLTAINVTNKVALYNFLSTFSGTHYVSPRAFTAELGFHF